MQKKEKMDSADGAAEVFPCRQRVTDEYLREKPTIACTSDVHYGVFDIETRRSAQEVGGWHRADRMGISCVVLYDSREKTYLEYLEPQTDELIHHLQSLDLVVGFNIKKFDYLVLSGYSDVDFNGLPTLDIMDSVHGYLHYRVSLNNLAEATLQTKKSADGLQALAWWKQGKTDKILEYCRKDVKITHQLYCHGKRVGHILFRNRLGKRTIIPVGW